MTISWTKVINFFAFKDKKSHLIILKSIYKSIYLLSILLCPMYSCKKKKKGLYLKLQTLLVSSKKTKI